MPSFVTTLLLWLGALALAQGFVSKIPARSVISRSKYPNPKSSNAGLSSSSKLDRYSYATTRSKMCMALDDTNTLEEFVDLFDSSVNRDCFISLCLSNRKMDPVKIDLTSMSMKGAIGSNSGENSDTQTIYAEEGDEEEYEYLEFPEITDDLRSCICRLVSLKKGGMHLQVTYRYVCF